MRSTVRERDADALHDKMTMRAVSYTALQSSDHASPQTHVAFNGTASDGKAHMQPLHGAAWQLCPLSCKQPPAWANQWGHVAARGSTGLHVPHLDGVPDEPAAVRRLPEPFFTGRQEGGRDCVAHDFAHELEALRLIIRQRLHVADDAAVLPLPA